MARINNLTDFLTDVSSAIKQKTGDNTPIPASDFDTEILSIETGGNYQSKTLNVTQNGNYNLLPDQEFDAISNVNISVSVSPVLQNKTVTENGSYSADSGYDGLGTVIVNVPQEGGSGDIKLFETEQAMQADPNPSEGDLAVVYRSDITTPSPGDTISSITPPDTVVFDTAITSSAFLTIRSTPARINLYCSLTASQFSIIDRYRSVITDVDRILYTSSDGITYTRTDGGTNTYDLGAEITLSSTANVNILQFLQSGGMVFEGLYEYVSRSDDYFTFGNFTNVSGQLYPDYVAQVAEPREKIMNILTPYLKENGYTLSYLTLVRKSTTEFVAYCSTANNAPKVLLDSSFIWLNDKTYISSMGYVGESDSYKIDINTETQQCLISPITATNSVTVGGVDKNYFEEITDYTFGMWFHPQRSFTVAYDNDGSWTTTSRPVSDLSVFKYRVASTQLTLADSNQLLPDVVGYGKNGIIVGDGSIYNNLDISQVLTTVLNRDLIISNNYITDANNNHIKYFKYDTDGDGTLVKTHTTPFYNAVYNTSYTPLKANDYGFEYISLDGKTYCYLNTDRNLVIVDLDTNTSTVITLATLTSTSNNSVILLRGRESLLYAKSDGYAYLYDIPSKIESKLSIPINTSAYYGFRVEYDDEDYALIQIKASGTSANKSIYVLNTKTLSVVTSISGTYTFCGAWKSNNGVYYFATQSTVYLYKFDGTSITRLRTSGMSMLTVNANECLEDNSYIYLISNNKNFTKVAKSGTTANATIAATYNISETNVLGGFLRFDNDYVWIITYTGTNYYMTKCTYSLTSQVPAFVEIQKVKIPYKMSFYKNASDVVTSNIFFNTDYIRLTETGFKEYAARTDTYDTSTYKVGSYEVKFVEESVFDNNDIIGATKQSAINGVYYPIYDL